MKHALPSLVLLVAACGAWSCARTVVAAHGQVAYVASETDGTISAIDCETDRVVATFHVGLRPRSIRVSPDGARDSRTPDQRRGAALVEVCRRAVAAGPAPPAGVKATPWRVRRNSARPRKSSSAAIWRETAPWVSASSCAARV